MRSTESLRIEELNDHSSFGVLSGEWDELLLSTSSPNPFLTHQWQSAWWENFSEGKSLKIVAVRDQSERLVGLGPLCLSAEEDRIELIGDQELCDYQDLLLTGGLEKEVFGAILTHLSASCGLPLYLHSLPASSPSLTILTQLAGEGDWDLKKTAEDTAPTLPLPSSFSEYLDSLSPHHRHELRRKLRKIETQGATALLRDDSGSKLDDFLNLHRSGSSEKGRFMDESREQFFRDIAGVFSKEGWFSLFFLQFEAESIASLICFDHGNSLYVYNSGYNPAYSSLSPGIVLLAYCIRDAISRGVREFNLLRGDEPYKYHLGAQDYKISTIWVRPRE